MRGLTSIIILTLNQLDYTKSCFDSLYEFTPEPFELIVVDNGSTDDTRTFLREFAQEHDNVTLVFNEKNEGFAGGCSQGMALARGDYQLLLNNDVIVTEGWLSRMIRPMLDDPEIGIVGPRSNYTSGAQLVPGATYSSIPEMHAYARRWAAEHAGQGWSTAIVIGFALLMRGEVARQIGGLDTRFGRGNFEDDDFCLRAQLAGWKIWVADDVFLHHFGSATFRGEKIDYTVLIDRNKAIFREKWALDRPIEGRPDIDGLGQQLRGKFSAEQLFVPLPDPATLPMVVDNIQIDGLKRCNLVLDARWDGPAEAWLPAFEAFAEVFGSSDPVTLIVAGPSETALERIGAILDARGDDAPDVLCIESRYEATPALLRLCQGVIPGAADRAEAVSHRARIFGKPVLHSPDRQGLQEWARAMQAASALPA